MVPTPLSAPLLNWYGCFPALHVPNAVCKEVEVSQSSHVGSQEETSWREHFGIQPSVSNVMASLLNTYGTEGPSKPQVSAPELQSSQQQSNSYCMETSNSWMQSECQFEFRAPSELIGLEYLLKGFPFLFSSATLALCFSPSGNHLACLWMNWLRVANSLLHCREKLSEKLSAKHPDSQLMQNSQHQWSDHFLISVRLHVSVRLFIWISAGSICNLFRALYHKFVDKVVQTNTPHSFLLLLVLFYIHWQYILRFILWA